MNRRIAELAAQPRGRKWRSRLIPYAPAIRQWRADGKTYRQIVDLLGDLDLHVSASAINDFIRVRDGCHGRCQYALPEELPSGATSVRICSAEHHLETSKLEIASIIRQPSPHITKKFIFHEPSVKRNGFTDDQLEINDPLTMQQS